MRLSIFWITPLLLQSSLYAWNLSLKDAEKIALSENPLYLISKEKVFQSEQKKLQAYANICPKIRYESFLAHTFEPSLVEQVSTGTLFFKKNLVMNKFELTQPIFSTDLYFDLTLKKQQKSLAEEQKNREKNALLFKVRKNYYGAILHQLKVEIEKDNVRYLQEALSIQKKRYESLSAPYLSVTQSAVATSNAVAIYYKALKSLKISRNALVESLGIDPSEEEEIDLKEKDIPIKSIAILQKKMDQAKKTFVPTDFSYLGKIRSSSLKQTLTLFTEKELENYLAIALSTLPELKIHKWEIAIRESELKERYGEYAPVITSFFDCQKNAGDPASRVFSQDDFSFAVGIKISWNLFDSFGRERKIKEASSKKISSKLRYRHSLQKTETMLRDLLYQIEDAIFSYLHAKNGVFYAKLSLDQAREKLLVGKIRPLDYRDAVNELSQAKNLQNEASFQLIVSYYELVYLLGTSVNDE